MDNLLPYLMYNISILNLYSNVFNSFQWETGSHTPYPSLRYHFATASYIGVFISNKSESEFLDINKDYMNIGLLMLPFLL
jgi:hypothetical protein